MKMLFSPSNCAFYVPEWESSYKSSGNWPEDLIKIDDDTYFNFTQQPPSKKQLGATNGLPAWVDVPPLTQVEISEINALKKSHMLREAGERISYLQTKLLMGRISDNEKAQLNSWLDYIDAMQAIDTNTASDIKWPEMSGT